MAVLKTPNDLFASDPAKCDPPDFTIKIDCYRWHVHSAMISKHSVFFEAVCNRQFKESGEKMVTLEEDCPRMVARMIQFLYTGEYSSTSRHTHCWGAGRKYYDTEEKDCVCYVNKLMQMGFCDDNIEELKELQRLDNKRSMTEVRILMLQIADKYVVTELRDIVMSEIFTKEKLDNLKDIKTVVQVIGLPELYHHQDLTDLVMERICDLICGNYADPDEVRAAFADDTSAAWHIAARMKSFYERAIDEQARLRRVMEELEQLHEQETMYTTSAHVSEIQKVRDTLKHANGTPVQTGSNTTGWNSCTII